MYRRTMKAPQVPDVGSFIKEQRERSALAIRTETLYEHAELLGGSMPQLFRMRSKRTRSSQHDRNRH